MRPISTAALALTLLASLPASAAEQRLLIAPHDTDARLSGSEAPHLVVYDPEEADKPDQPLLIWLPGTHGKPASGPAPFFDTVRKQGYRLLGIAYKTELGVSNVCKGVQLQMHKDCAEQFRQQRVWGDSESHVIDDKPEDAIVPRLVKLLQHLAKTAPTGGWDQYLKDGEPRWERILLAGQSQGGGMAGFLAQTRSVAGVLMFSGGWDQGRRGDIADWYRRPSKTPAERWFATYHLDEPMGSTMARIYRALGVPPEHISALKLPVQGANAHGEAIHNLAYRPLWLRALARQTRPAEPAACAASCPEAEPARK
ncbi:MAG TPA: hypothetical protein VGE47_11840 [Burkholderiaceae bacterium]